ncbi:contractile injection system tape measure protein, partial [Kosakonia sp. BK9b]
TTLRVTLFIDPVLNQQRKTGYHSINKEQLRSVLQTAKNNVAINSNIMVDKVVLNLGTIPLQHCSLYFYQRLHTALVQLFRQLASHARSASLSMGEKGIATAPARQGSLVTQAIACLQSGGAKTDFWRSEPEAVILRAQDPSRREALVGARNGRHARRRATSAHTTARFPGGGQGNASATASTRLTPLRLAHQALSYLLTIPEGRHWLSQHSMTHEQRDAWAAAIVQQELPTVAFLRLVALLEPLPVAQARAIAGRWVIPLWRYAGVAKTVQQQAGKAAQQQIEDYLTSLLPEAVTPARSQREVLPVRPGGGLPAYEQERQNRKLFTTRQSADAFPGLQASGPEAFPVIRTQQGAESHISPQTQQSKAAFPAWKTPQRSGVVTRQQRQPNKDAAIPRRPRARRANEETPEAGLSVSNAGVVLLWPLLPQWFTALGLMAEKQFISDDARWQAVVALDWLIWEVEQPEAPRCVVNQFLCGIALNEPPPILAPFNAEQQQLTAAWAASVLSQIATFEKMGLTDVRQLFLQRPGELFADLSPAVLHIAPEPFDILLAKWPWPLNLAFFPWFDAPLLIEWATTGPEGLLR